MQCLDSKDGLLQPRYHFSMMCTQSAILGQPGIKLSRYFVTIGTTDWINLSSLPLPVLYIWTHVSATREKLDFLRNNSSDFSRHLLEGYLNCPKFLDTASFYTLNAKAKALRAFIFGQMSANLYTCILIKLIKPQKTYPARNLTSAPNKSAIAQGKKKIHTANSWRNH